MIDPDDPRRFGRRFVEGVVQGAGIGVGLFLFLHVLALVGVLHG